MQSFCEFIACTMALRLTKVTRSFPSLTFLLARKSCTPSRVPQYPRFLLVSNARSLASRSQPPDRPSVQQDGSDSDSDSEDERHHASYTASRGESEFWRRKMRTLHGILDVNKDGVISFDDFTLLTNRFSNLAHMTPEHHEQFKNLMKDVWEAQYGPVDPYNLITTEQFLEEMHHALNDKELRKKIHNFLPYLFKAVDKERTGAISVKEYKLFFKCLGLSDEDAVLAFSTIDENEDGKLTMAEFVHIGKKFFLSEDEHNTSKWFWGPLVHH